MDGHQEHHRWANEMDEIIESHFANSLEVKRRALTECRESIKACAGALIDSFRDGGKLLLCGNGGSAADCQHFASELTSLCRRTFPRPGLPAIALTTDTSYLTARANDFGFDEVFARLTQTLGRPGDVLLGISTSGNSENVIRAVSTANEMEMQTIAFTGESGGKLGSLAHFGIRVPSLVTQYIQECHIVCIHVLCQVVEETLFERRLERNADQATYF